VRIAFDEPLTDAHDAHMTLVRMSKKARRDLEEA
jgi:putative heme iron utilization protein